MKLSFSVFWRYFDFPDILRFSPYNCYIWSIYFCFKALTKTLSIMFFLNLFYTFIIYDGQKINEQQAKSNHQQAKCNEQRGKSNKQKASSNE